MYHHSIAQWAKVVGALVFRIVTSLWQLPARFSTMDISLECYYSNQMYTTTEKRKESCGLEQPGPSID